MPTIEVTQAEGQELKEAVDDDIRRFEEWFKSLPNDPLTPSERAIISTYLFFKVKVEGAVDGS